MSESPAVNQIALSVLDLQVVEHIILMRMTTRDAEYQRAERMRTLVRVTAELSRALSTYSRHALVHCQGTAGASDLSEDTRWLTEALGAFCEEIGAVSQEFATVIGHEEPSVVGAPAAALPARGASSRYTGHPLHTATAVAPQLGHP